MAFHEHPMMPPVARWSALMALGSLCATLPAACDRGVIELLEERDSLGHDGGFAGAAAAGGAPASTARDAGADHAAPPADDGPCTQNTDCTEPTPVCDRASRTCVPCECPSPFTCDSTGACSVIPCGPGGECPDWFPICDPTRNACVQCVTSVDCRASAPSCFDGICGQCATDMECPFERPHCNTFFHMCIDGCFDDADCPVGSYCARDRRCR